ncbi:glycosyltransferase family 1 protein [Desemzia sp. FAM 23991]|uniref:glycosyltransferase family 1 protein n=1 Tax=unclassified Desemzia TaxID=2685243 RepID=UPI00388825AC
MDKPLRVLHFQGRMGKGGAETFMMNAYRNIDRSKFQFDFLIYNDFEDIRPYNKEIHDLGGHIYAVPNPKKNILGYIRGVTALFKEKHFDIVHSEVFFGGGLNLLLAKRAGIDKRIVHSHATTDGKKNNLFMSAARKLFDRLMRDNATDYLACSTEAGIGLYGKNQPFIFVPNGIDLNMYRNVPKGKEGIREEINVPKDAFVVGNIGRFEEQKNHSFLIDIFEEIVQQQPNSFLLLIGEGSLRNQIEQKVSSKKLQKNVLFLGLRDDIPELLKAMDVFLMPSLYEGLPISAVEAQAANIKLVLSTEVSSETQLSKNVHFISLKENTEKWAEETLKKPYTNEPLPELAQYDMEYTAILLDEIYSK